jgi:hypothetical protein
MEKPATQEVQDLMTARWVADMIGAAAQLELADFINAGPKTAEEITKAKGLHASSLYRLLRALASYGIFVEREVGTFCPKHPGRTPFGRMSRILPGAWPS